MINYLEVKQLLQKSLNNKVEKMVLVHDRKKGEYYRKQLVNANITPSVSTDSHTEEDEFEDADYYLNPQQKAFVTSLYHEYKPWLNSLTTEETNELKDYTSDNYVTINNHLRYIPSKYPLTPKRLNEIYHSVKAITSALNKSEVKTPLIVYRQVKGLDLLGKLKSCMESGGTWEDPAFMSTTVIKDSFNVPANKGAIHLVIDIPKGKGIGGFVKGLSEFPEEQEFLLNKGSRFEVKNIENPKTNQYVVHLKLVGRNTEDDVNYDL